MLDQHLCHSVKRHKNNQQNLIYTCPMHPEIEQETPGDCPICGMALEPKGVSMQENTFEVIDMTRRFWICAFLSFPILLLGMLKHFPNFPLAEYISPTTSLWIEFSLSTPIMLWGAIPFFKKAWLSIISRNLNMFTLIALGTGVAYIYSLVAAFFPNIFPEEMRTWNGPVAVYFEASAVIITLVMLGQVLELRARSQTNNAIRELLTLTPKTALVVQKDGPDKETPLDEIVPGDLLRIRPGDSVPLDGVIISGSSILDESMITGESMPTQKSVGDVVTGGTKNHSGSFVMEAQKVGQDTLLSQIVHMVSEAQRSRAPIQKTADTVAGYFVPIVVGSSIITAVAWSIWGPSPSISYALINAVAVLIIACPCAIGLATPLSIMVGTGRGAQAGILIKNAESIETLEKINVLIVDKTGTLTEGKPKLNSINVEKGQDANEILQLAASLEQGSEHPLAMAIIKAAHEKRITLTKAEQFTSFTGKGISGIVNSKLVSIGNQKLLEDFNIKPSKLLKHADNLRAQGQTIMFVMVDHRLVGTISVSDPIKKTTLQALNDLRKSGLRIVMLTGDNEITAKAVANKLEIDEIEADVLPERKNEVVKRFQMAGYKVAMAGDGINDAPALAQANVGIAMGTGADIAMESADITLVKGDLTGIARARHLSQAIMKNIRENLFFAFFYNITGVPIAAGILYPVFGLLLNPIIASAAMVFSSLSVILNAARLKKVKL